MNLQDVLGLGESLTKETIIKQVTTFALSKLGLAAGPIGWLVSFIIKLTINYLIWPALENMLGYGALIYRKQVLATKVEAFKEAQTNEDLDSAFDNLISGS